MYENTQQLTPPQHAVMRAAIARHLELPTPVRLEDVLGSPISPQSPVPPAAPAPVPPRRAAIRAAIADHSAAERHAWTRTLARLQRLSNGHEAGTGLPPELADRDDLPAKTRRIIARYRRICMESRLRPDLDRPMQPVGPPPCLRRPRDAQDIPRRPGSASTAASILSPSGAIEK